MTLRQRIRKKLQAKKHNNKYRLLNKENPEDGEIKDIQHKADKKIREKKRYKVRKNKRKREEKRKERKAQRPEKFESGKLASWLLIPEEQVEDK